MGNLEAVVMAEPGQPVGRSGNMVTEQKSASRDYAGALCVAFAEYAGDSLERWQLVEGCSIKNSRLGAGIISEVSRINSVELRVQIEFKVASTMGCLGRREEEERT